MVDLREAMPSIPHVLVKLHTNPENNKLILVRIEANNSSSLSISSLERLQGVQGPGVPHLLIESEGTAIRVSAILPCDEERVKELESFGCHKILTEDKTIWHAHLEEKRKVCVCVTCLIYECSNTVHLQGLYGAWRLLNLTVLTAPSSN